MQVCKFREQEREELGLLGPPHPGEIVREEMLPRLGLTQKALAKRLNVSYSTVLRFLKGRRRVTSELAVALARVSGTQALYWLVLQAHHDAWTAQRAYDAEVLAQREAESALRHGRRLPRTLVRLTDIQSVSQAPVA